MTHKTVQFGWNRFGTLFAALHGSIHNHFNGQRNLTSRTVFKEYRTAALAEWRQICAA
jgi:putative transposase